MRIFFICFILLVIGSVSFSQTTLKTDSIYNVNQLNFMEGNWVGKGWIIGRDQEVKNFSQQENVTTKISGNVLLIEGIGHAIDSTGVTEKVIHQAFGLITFNPNLKCVTMLSISPIGGRMETILKQKGDKIIQWSFDGPRKGSIIRFTEDFSVDGIWNEVGEISFDGINWKTFFEMTLRKE